MARPPVRERAAPRISANDLALYMVSSETAKIGIIRRSKFPQTAPMIRYRDARAAVAAYLTDPLHSVNHLTVAEDMLNQRIADPSTSALATDDARHSIDVLHAIQGMRNQLGSYDFSPAPLKQNALLLGGIEVSVRADLLVHGSARGEDQIGVAVLRMSMDDGGSEAANQKRREMGLYVATLGRFHVEQNLAGNRTPANRLCLSIDIQHGEAFSAPNANTRRMNDLESACRMIGAMWDTIER